MLAFERVKRCKKCLLTARCNRADYIVYVSKSLWSKEEFNLLENEVFKMKKALEKALEEMNKLKAETGIVHSFFEKNSAI